VFIQLFISGGILGFLLGLLLCSRMIRWWQSRAVRRRDMDQLIAQFHALFRQIDQEKQQRP
jgi:hypothetical protein